MLDIDAEIRRALKAKDHTALTGYRSLKAKGEVRMSEPGRREDTAPGREKKALGPEEWEALIRREVKERRESNEYLDPARPEYGVNARIVELLEAHLPKALEAEELEAVIAKAIAEANPSGPRDMGKVMAALREVPGVDMKAASARVKERLQALEG